MANERTPMNPMDQDMNDQRNAEYELRRVAPSYITRPIREYIKGIDDDNKKVEVTKDEKDKAERALVEEVLNELFMPVVKKLYEASAPYPYDTRMTIEMGAAQVKTLRRIIESQDAVASSGDVEKRRVVAERGREEATRLRALEEWLSGSCGVLESASAVVSKGHDGFSMMGDPLRTNPRYEATATDFYNMYTRLKEVKNWDLGKEIIDKQDSIYNIFRGMAGVGQRRVGRPETYGQTLNLDHRGFVEKVFGKDGLVEVAESLITDGSRPLTVSEAQREVDQLMAHGMRNFKLAVGREYVVNGEFVNRVNRGDFDGWTIWVKGVPQRNGRQEARMLADLVGSGEIVLIGTEQGGNRDMRNLNSWISSDSQVSIVREVPKTIDSPFLNEMSPKTAAEMQRKLSIIIDLKLWQRLSRGEDWKVVYRDYENEYQKRVNERVETSVLDKYIIDSTIVTLRYFCEGAQLGWSIDFGDEKVNGVATGRTERQIGTGGPKSCTDIATAFDWLRTQAGNTWKDWSKAMFPLTKQVSKWIDNHERGWLPNVNERGVWSFKDEFGNDFSCDMYGHFDMSFLEAEGSRASGKFMPMVFEGKAMSELPWDEMAEGVTNRWFITMSQMVIPLVLTNKLPDKDTMVKLFGEGMYGAPRINEILEEVKRFWLGHRDFKEGNEMYAKAMPLLLAEFIAWSENELSTSPAPGGMVPNKVDAQISYVNMALGDLAPSGNRELGEKVRRRFLVYSKQFKTMGENLAKRTARRALGWR